MSVEELASISDTSAKQVSRFIYILDSQGYLFRKRARTNGTLEYRLIIEPQAPCVLT